MTGQRVLYQLPHVFCFYDCGHLQARAMATTDTSSNVHHRNTSTSQRDHPTENGVSTPVKLAELQLEDLRLWRKHMEQVKVGVLEEVQEQISGLLDRTIKESVESFSKHTNSPVDRKEPKNASRLHKPGDGKAFIARQSLLDELFEISHIRTIYHMFIAALFLFISSTIAVDYIDQGSLVPEFDLFFYAFGQLSVVVWSWLLMFSYTLLGPYFALCVWGELYHSSGWRVLVSITAGLLLAVAETALLLVFPVYVILHHQLPPASRFILAIEQIRFFMKSYSFIRETVPAVIQNKPKEGCPPKTPTLSSYLYFLFAPTLIFRESYPRNPYIRWNYIGLNLFKIMSSIFYLNFILVRLCIPVFTNEDNKPFTTRTLVLAMFHASFPGMLMFLLGFYAFLHCWLNTFAELMRFADRMFYQDWWNSTSFANYYRTWNIVVHDWLYYYGYRDFLVLSKRKFRSAAMLGVFAVSGLVHEYALTMLLGFFYPVMFCTFAGFGMMFNFAINDKRKSHFWNIIMWTCLMFGQGIHVCLYCQEWYALIHCPRTGTSFWELVTPRSWFCDYK
ncbi:sterol O-acyltransferase 2 isoform X2 [Alosa alosa]|uniref:sterol O-acyltransferase 2 isoform X2 n=1 Tax=Alosa alosa TaxID=278164 RepID=UPI0020151AC4|nr:sterol O-acyltransferase 2 isoform X2 [Alosa alosa]